MSIFNSKKFNKTTNNNNILIPINTNTIDIGNENNRFKNVYISGNLNNSSFIANRVLLSNSDKNITSSSITDTELGYISGISSNVQTQLNNKINNTTTVSILNLNVSSNTILHDLQVNNLTVNGTTTTVNTENILLEDNLILINSNQIGNPSSSLKSGIEVERGDLDNYRFVFDESDDSFKIGTINDLQKVATREDTPTDKAIAVWNSATNRFDTNSNYTVGTATNSDIVNKTDLNSAISGVQAGSIIIATCHLAGISSLLTLSPSDILRFASGSGNETLNNLYKTHIWYFPVTNPYNSSVQAYYQVTSNHFTFETSTGYITFINSGYYTITVSTRRDQSTTANSELYIVRKVDNSTHDLSLCRMDGAGHQQETNFSVNFAGYLAAGSKIRVIGRFISGHQPAHHISIFGILQ